MKYFSHLNSAVAIIELYDGRQPFHLFIKDFFRQHKKYGSKDRKSITHLAYCFFRLGNTVKKKTTTDRVIAGLFLCSQHPNEWLENLQPEWNQLTSASLADKCAAIGIDITDLPIFPFQHALSNDIDIPAFNLSHLRQPGFFVRIRPGHKKDVINKLETAAISYRLLTDTCIELPAFTNIDTVLAVNKEVVIQDYSSQRVASLLPSADEIVPGSKVWDCCAASGGKSILIKDIFGDIDLTVSDLRPTIIANLKKRFSEAGITHYKSFVIDLSKPDSILPAPDSRLIIADVPCSGSGTWGRTPEMLSYFNEKEISRYQSLQQKIAINAVRSLQQDGFFLYITCSVFKQENEEMVQFITSTTPLLLVRMELLKGYTMGADTMFAALFIKGKS